MKILIKILLLIIIEFIVLWYRIVDSDAVTEGDSAVWLMLIFCIFAFGVNLVITIILFALKNKNAIVFLVNTIVLPCLIYYVITKGLDKEQKRRYEGWTFQYAGKTYDITHFKLKSEFSINRVNGIVFTPVSRGKLITNGNELNLYADSAKYTIRNSYLFGFTNQTDSIKLMKDDN